MPSFSKAAFHFPLVPIPPHSDLCSSSYHRCKPTAGFHTQTQDPNPLPAACPSHNPAAHVVLQNTSELRKNNITDQLIRCHMEESVKRVESDCLVLMLFFFTSYCSHNIN